ncbi:MAG: hypothetical protein ACLP8S_10100 [Solirubrobacteraceae bacterium]
MARHRDEIELEPTVSFRPPWLPAHDGVLAEHPRGFAGDLAPDRADEPGAVPPPPPKKPAPRESLRERLEGR